MMRIADLMGIIMETPRINSGCSLEKEFIELICINQFYSYDGCVYGHGTSYGWMAVI